MTDKPKATLTQDDYVEIRDLLLGRRIVAAETSDAAFTDKWGMTERASGKLTLDDGTEVLVIPNQGGCACDAGDYTLRELATTDNAITSVELVDEEVPYDAVDGPSRRYRIFVFTEAAKINILTVDGDDGSGYYGTGYELVVIA